MLVSKHETITPVCAYPLTASHGHSRVTPSDLDCNRAAVDLTTPDVCGATIGTRAISDHDKAADFRVPRWKYAIGTACAFKGQQALPPQKLV